MTETNQCAYCGLKLQQGLEQMKAHVLECEKHPLAAMKKERDTLETKLITAKLGLKACRDLKSDGPAVSALEILEGWDK